MIGDLFDSPWKILIVAVVIIVLFGSKKLPGAARSLGQSMRILKREVSDLHHDEEPAAAPKDGGGPSTQLPQAQLAPAAAPPADQQGQIDALQQQIRDLQRAATMDTSASAGSTAEPQRTQQPS
ncbi:MAG TPA: Sec-independent protein translocase subunit TatA [Streptosporangiaceae bacterium]|nr:Sec-independent protein translocase subunit TatA [Streptosporangiaceae bacterium]